MIIHSLISQYKPFQQSPRTFFLQSIEWNRLDCSSLYPSLYSLLFPTIVQFPSKCDPLFVSCSQSNFRFLSNLLSNDKNRSMILQQYSQPVHSFVDSIARWSAAVPSSMELYIVILKGTIHTDSLYKQLWSLKQLLESNALLSTLIKEKHHATLLHLFDLFVFVSKMKIKEQEQVFFPLFVFQIYYRIKFHP